MGSGFWVGFFAALAILLPVALLAAAHGLIRASGSGWYRRQVKWIEKHPREWGVLFGTMQTILGVVLILTGQPPFFAAVGIVMLFLHWNPRAYAWLSSLDGVDLTDPPVVSADKTATPQRKSLLHSPASPDTSRSGHDAMPSAAELRRDARTRKVQSPDR